MLNLLPLVDALKTSLELDLAYVIANPRKVINAIKPLVKAIQAEAKGLSSTDQHYIADLVGIIAKLSAVVDALTPPIPTPAPKPTPPPMPAPVLPVAPAVPVATPAPAATTPAPAPAPKPAPVAPAPVAPVVTPAPAPVAPVAPVAAPVVTPAPAAK